MTPLIRQITLDEVALKGGACLQKGFQGGCGAFFGQDDGHQVAFHGLSEALLQGPSLCDSDHVGEAVGDRRGACGARENVSKDTLRKRDRRAFGRGKPWRKMKQVEKSQQRQAPAPFPPRAISALAWLEGVGHPARNAVGSGRPGTSPSFILRHFTNDSRCKMSVLHQVK